MSFEDNFGEYFILRDETAINHHCRSGLEGWFNDNGKIKILMLPGSGCNTKKDANAMCKRAQVIVGSRLAAKCEFYSVYYPDSDKGAATIAYRTQKVFDKLFVPLLTHKNADSDLQLLPEETIVANLKNRINMTHCYGSYLIEAMDKEMFSFLNNIGLDWQKAENIQRNLLCVHNNNLSESVGKISMHGTHIYRMTQSDEKRTIGDYELDSFQHYFRKEKLTDDEVLFVPLNKNEYALVVPTVTPYGRDHNRGYWSEQKSDSGEYEELFLRAILAEKIEDKKDFVSIDEYIDRALKKYPLSSSFINKIVERGMAYGKKFKIYVDEIHTEFEKLKQKILQNTIIPETLKQTSYAALLMNDEYNNMLIDYAAMTKDPVQMQEVWSAISERLPRDEASGKKTDENANIALALERQRILAQKMLDEGNAKCFMALCDNYLDLSEFDYEKAGAEVVPVLVNKVISLMPPEDKKADSFYKLAVKVYACAVDNSAGTYVAKLEDSVFNPENIANASRLRMIKKHCDDYGVGIDSLGIKKEAGKIYARPINDIER